MGEKDEDLVALIDDELDEGRRRDLLVRLEQDASLRQRYDALRDAKAPIGAAFGTLLEQAPLSRLRAAIPPERARIPQRGERRLVYRQLAAGLVAGLLLAAALAWAAFDIAGSGKDDWRTAVVDYMKLYTDETFAFRTPERETQAQELGFISSRVGAPLTPDSVALPGLDFKAAFILAYDGAPLAEMAFVDKAGAPILVCITANGAPDAPVRGEVRDNFSLATWSQGRRSYLVIGRVPKQRAVEYAELLQPRI